MNNMIAYKFRFLNLLALDFFERDISDKLVYSYNLAKIYLSSIDYNLRVLIQHSKSLILAQDERWRRA